MVIGFVCNVVTSITFVTGKIKVEAKVKVKEVRGRKSEDGRQKFSSAVFCGISVKLSSLWKSVRNLCESVVKCSMLIC